MMPRTSLLCCLLAAGFIADGRGVAADGSLVRPGAAWSYFKGTIAPPFNWASREFDDAGWPTGPSGFSFGFGNYEEATVLPDMRGNYLSLFLRRPFLVTQPGEVVWPVLRIDYNDGFVAYLNGTEIARRGLAGNVGEPVPFNAGALPHPRGATEEIDLRAFRTHFQEGTNVLALQVHRSHLDNATLAVVPELLAGITRGPFLQSTSSNRTLVVWKTALPADSRVEFGPTPQLGELRYSASPASDHVIELAGLLSDTTYFYRVASTAAGETVRSEVRSFRTLKAEGAVRFLEGGRHRRRAARPV